ncbi:MAG: hypothetical protein ABEJ89_08850, partial [Haloarculaceae archaeon]
TWFRPFIGRYALHNNAGRGGRVGRDTERFAVETSVPPGRAGDRDGRARWLSGRTGNRDGDTHRTVDDRDADTDAAGPDYTDVHAHAHDDRPGSIP